MKFVRKILRYFVRKNGEPDSNTNITVIGGGNPTVTVGEFTYINQAKLYCWKPGFRLTIGSYCSFAEGISFILGGEHDLQWVSTYPFIERWRRSDLSHKLTKKCRGDITIGSDVWLGHGVTILSGTNIGVGAVIGAGAVVRGDIPPYSIAVGVPARIVRRRFSDEICDLLLESRWWEMGREKLDEMIEYFDDPSKFLIELKKRHANCD
jgi:acetyltransferase-like isoleucine patch superfamily enzyme